MGLCPMCCARQTTGAARVRPCRACSQRIGSCVQKAIVLTPRGSNSAVNLLQNRVRRATRKLVLCIAGATPDQLPLDMNYTQPLCRGSFQGEGNASGKFSTDGVQG
ncbi:uncharacterized protein B0H64DRAFT_399347 [Chaetomium fimeti]|uniref:Uncharacterized protein n=1 Tax=Chaetomium fimeti TaxID=1854472 RepID=A0AAE0LQS4_9PEZI|nr:hypothetical protein B0H64DRAFT_399347 [Chaetomium fimeti]